MGFVVFLTIGSTIRCGNSLIPPSVIVKSVPKSSGRADQRAQAAASAPVRVEDGPLATLVGHRVRKAHSHYFKGFSEALAELGLAPGQYSALFLIGLNPNLSQLALAEAAGIDPTTIVPITERFARDGWVRRIRRPEDRRVYRLRLTAEGEAVLAKARPLVEAYERKLTARLSSAERIKVRELLARIGNMEVDPITPVTRKPSAPARSPRSKSTGRSAQRSRGTVR
jgi:DNA-binding MarR family transcriptional regulator